MYAYTIKNGRTTARTVSGRVKFRLIRSGIFFASKTSASFRRKIILKKRSANRIRCSSFELKNENTY